MRFQLKGIDNDYYLAKFESDLDYNNVVSKGPWVIFSHYLIVQPWLTQLSTLKAFPQYVMAWVCILGLSRALYKRILLQEIQSLIGKVVKSDFQMEKDLGASLHGLRCKFEHLRDVCPHVSLEKGMEGDGEILHGNKSSD
ncbi:hypothetical protein Goari_022679 [Gossypium aridum]|uniref:DUF4283 domain-containing protein n=1 Tax=Gossypium aridum TaxID=34290 RepID=A0A7J8YQ22_GOSAI|nr:hypothetical protein [Gossypium aridum]